MFYVKNGVKLLNMKKGNPPKEIWEIFWEKSASHIYKIWEVLIRFLDTGGEGSSEDPHPNLLPTLILKISS